MDEITKLMDQLIELSEQRTTHMKRINLLIIKYKNVLEAHGNYVLSIAPLLKRDVAEELLSDLRELGEIIQEFGESMEILGEDLVQQMSLDIKLVEEIEKHE